MIQMDGELIAGVAVLESEGCAADAVSSADIAVRSVHDAFGLITNPDRICATLRG